MSEFPGRASAVIVGAGIVGNSLACHLARLGWRDLVLVDKGPMPNPGGSTGHASNFIFPIEYSKMMMELTRDSTEQYQALGVFTQSGGIEVARTPARMAELRRRCTAAKAWGIPAQVITPAEVAKLVPYLDESVILGGAHFPTVGVVDSLRAGTLMREEAQASGALTVLAGAEVLGIDTAGPPGGAPRITAVRTTAGDIETPVVVVCCGVWSPRIARMAGAHIPLTPTVHQMISVGPIALFAGTPGEISYPIVRDVDTNMYERQHGGDMEVGSYAHRPIIVSPDDIPSIEESALSPTELPFTADDFDPQLAEALELMPELLGDESAGVRYAINGLISMTPDGHPLLGPVPGVDGLWSAAASWIKEGPGVGRAVAEWMSGQVPRWTWTRPTSPGSTRASGPRRTSRRGPARASTRCTASCTRPSSGSPAGRSGSARCTSGNASSARCSTRPPGGSARTGTPRTRRCWAGTRGGSCRAPTSGTPAGGRR